MPKLASKLVSAYRRRKELRRPTHFRFAIADRVDLLDPARWDELTRDASFFLQRPYLRMLEQSGPDNLEPRYALICDDEEAVAAVTMRSFPSRPTACASNAA